MPRVVPSDVLTFIEQVFAGRNPDQKLDQGTSPQIAALVALIDRVPEELFVIPSSEFAPFLAAVETLRDGLRTWQSGGERVRYWQIPYTPIATIRSTLAKCPNEAP